MSPAVLEAMGTPLTNKYAEGLPGKRYYGGCEFVDMVEQLAIDRAKQLFGAEHANVQPHSGAQANMRGVSRVPQAGRHVPRHGPVARRPPHARLAGELLRACCTSAIPYGVRDETGCIDYDAMRDARARRTGRR